MIHRNALRRRLILTAVLAWSFTVLLLLDSTESQASDQDGVAGYSIRLKNKDFDGSDSGSSSNLVVLAPSGKMGVPSPQGNSVEQTKYETRTLLSRLHMLWVISFPWRE